MVSVNGSNPPSAPLKQTATIPDGAPASDSDPYSSRLDTRAYNIDTTSFSKPIPIFGGLLGYTNEWFNQLYAERIGAYSALIKRDLTDEEANAVAYHFANQSAIYSYSAPIGLIGGAYRWNSTKATFQFPFYKPNMETFMPALMKSQQGRMFMSGLRLSSYSIVGIGVAQILIAGFSVSNTVAGIASDKRLKNLTDELGKQSREKANATQQQRGAARAGQRSQAPVPTNTIVDDASPSGGMAWEEPVIADNSTETSSSPVLNRPVQPAQRIQPSSQSKPTPSQTSKSRDDGFGMGDSATNFFGTDDDASPTNGRGMSSDTQPASQTQGSAWDRLRKGGNTTPGNSGVRSGAKQGGAWQRQQHQGETMDGQKQDDDYQINKADEEKSYAREEAQAEFDARVERERRGGDFGSGNNNEQKRW